MLKTTMRIAAVGGIAAMLAAACSSSKSSSSSSSASSSATTTANGGKTVKVGFFGALTGPNSPQLGINIRDGVKLAIDQYNRKGAGPKVEEVDYDSQGDPSIAPSQAQKAVSDGTVAIVGPAFSGESKAVDDTFEQAKIVSVTPSATAAVLATHGWKYWHRIVATDDFQGPADVKWLTKKLGAKKVGVIDDKSDYGKGLADTVRQGLPAAGATVVSDSIDPKSQDFSSTVNAMHSANVNAIFYGGYYADLARLMKQLRDGGVAAPIVSDDGSSDNKLLAGANATEANVYTTCACLIATADPAATDFVTAYKAAMNADPGTYSTEGYDAANLILDAIGAGYTTGPSIDAYINGSSYSFKGLSKTITFDSKGEVPGGVIDIYQGKAGALVLLGQVDKLVG
ncbi:MAG: branched-chain amino acid ABC transporter substrate-binding protein [Acidimicrobiales bacterium]